MNIKVFLERRNEHRMVQMREHATVAVLLQEMNINPVETVVARNGTIVTEDAVLDDGDDVNVFSVVSGG
jgi:sulfur carrier protein ThiS